MNKKQELRKLKASTALDLIHGAVNRHSTGEERLKEGQKIGYWLVSHVNLHMVGFQCVMGRDKGYSTSIQISFVDSMGELTHAGRLALEDVNCI